MPSSLDKLIKRRGGSIRWRAHKINKSQYLLCAVTRKKGKKGGRTVCTVKKYKHRKKR